MSELRFKLGLDNGQYVSGMKAAQAEVRNLSSAARTANLGTISGALQQLTGSVSSFTGAVKPATFSLREMWENLRNGTGPISAVTGGLSGAAAGVGVFAAATTAALAVLKDYAPYDSMVRGLLNVEGTVSGTKARLEELRDVAKMPGLGFEEAVQGDIRLRNAGLSAELSKGAILGFGNALASVGRGKADLDGVILALGQIAAKGKVSAEEINQIAERVPQIRRVMKDAFGTADTEALQKMGMNSTRFISGMVAELGKLPKVTAGAQNAVENFDDAWKALKNSSTEFAVDISGNWINDVSRSMTYARKLVEQLKTSMGVGNKALQGPEGTAPEPDNTAEIAAEKEAAAARADVAQKNAEYAARMEAERLEAVKRNAAARQKIEEDAAAKIKEAQEKVFAATLTEAQNLQRKLDAAKAEGDYGAAAVNSMKDAATKAVIAERTARIVELQKQLADLTARQADDAERVAQAANDAGEAVVKEAAAKQAAQAGFQGELAILEARAAGNDALANSLERQAALEALKLRIMQEQGLSAQDALALANRQMDAQRKISEQGEKKKGRSRLYSAEESQQRRFDRLSASDRQKFGSLEEFTGRNSTDRLGLSARQRAREATEAASRAAGTNKADKPGTELQALAKKQAATLTSIDQRLSDLGLAKK